MRSTEGEKPEDEKHTEKGVIIGIAVSLKLMGIYCRCVYRVLFTYKNTEHALIYTYTYAYTYTYTYTPMCLESRSRDRDC